MAIHLSLRVAPLDLQQGGNSRILYVHVPAARMSILVYIVTAINTFLFLLTKHPLFLRSSGTGIEMGAFSTLFTLVTGGFRGRPMWGTFWVWDARLTSVFILFLIYLGALRFQKLPVEPAPISIRAGPIDIPIIKSSVNWWNTLHQPGSISRSGAGYFTRGNKGMRCQKERIEWMSGAGSVSERTGHVICLRGGIVFFDGDVLVSATGAMRANLIYYGCGFLLLISLFPSLSIGYRLDEAKHEAQEGISTLTDIGEKTETLRPSKEKATASEQEDEMRGPSEKEVPPRLAGTKENPISPRDNIQ
nr:cytochrome C biogenesis C [Ipomoea batatas]